MRGGPFPGEQKWIDEPAHREEAARLVKKFRAKKGLERFKAWAREVDNANRAWEAQRPFICGCGKRVKSQGDLDAHRESTGH